MKNNWPRHLTAALEAAMLRPFAWGRHDCCLFAADCVIAMTGDDPMKAFRGKYVDRETALAALKEISGSSLYNVMRKKFGHPRPPKRGDIVYQVFEDGPTLGICDGVLCWFVGEEGKREGLVSLPTSEIKRGFRCG